MNYYALVGDLKESRKSPDRKALQEVLLAQVEAINTTYAGHVAAQLMVNAGDAFQGLFLSQAPVLEICDRIRYALADYCGVRMGIGFGAIETSIKRTQSILSDGPAFWNARKALSLVREQDYYDTRTTALYTDVQGLQTITGLVNQVLVLQDQVTSRWKNTQLELAKHYLMHHGFEKVSQTQVAKEMSLRVQQVNTTVQAMGFFAYLDTRRETEQILIAGFGGSAL